MADGIELRPFDPGRIGEVVAAWNAAAGRAFPLREALFRQNTVLDPHFDPAGASLACEASTGRVVGCGLAKVAREPLGADGLPMEESRDEAPEVRQYLVCVAERDLKTLLPLLPQLANNLPAAA